MLATCTLLGLAVVGLTGCGTNSSADKDILRVGAIGFASTLEPTENYFSWVVVRYGIGETLVKFDDTMKAKPWLASKWSDVYKRQMRDYPLIEGFVLWVAIAYMCINALVDASYVLLDPRLKRERA